MDEETSEGRKKWAIVNNSVKPLGDLFKSETYDTKLEALTALLKYARERSYYYDQLARETKADIRDEKAKKKGERK